MPANVRAQVDCDIKDLTLADSGKRCIEWAFHSMPVLQCVRKDFIKSQSLTDLRIVGCMQVTPATANLMIALKNGGARVVLCGIEPQFTQDDVAASLVRDHAISVYATSEGTPDSRHQHVRTVAETKPHIILDDGCDVIGGVQSASSELLGATIGQSGMAFRLRELAKQDALTYPAITVHDAQVSTLFQCFHGSAQFVLSRIIQVANVLLAGMHVVVLGYGVRGKGIALRARGLGASVIVVEVDPVRAVDAVLNGFRVMTSHEAAVIGDLFLTTTGSKCVLAREHFGRMKNGAILCNASPSPGEIDLDTLARISTSHREARESVEEFNLGDGRKLAVISQSPSQTESFAASALDAGLASHALAADYLVKHHGRLGRGVHSFPAALDRAIARFKLDSLNVQLDRLTPEQERQLYQLRQDT